MEKSHPLSFLGDYRGIALKLNQWYLPFVLCMGALMVQLIGACCLLTGNASFPLNIAFGVLILFLILTLLLWGIACWTLFENQPTRDGLEIGYSRRELAELYDLVEKVARKRKTPLPDEIRIHLLDVAYVYEEPDGKRILGVGGLAIASLSRKALWGIIAHELGHFNEGDTAVSRHCRDTFVLMEQLEAAFQLSPLNFLNPLNQAVRGYHRLFRSAWAGMQRESEVFADQYEVDQVGAKQCARSTILLHALENLPWTKLTSVADFCHTSRVPMEQLFTTQARRIRQTSPSEWREATGKALREKTSSLDSHPCLKDRLKAIGINREQATKIAASLNQTGSPLSESMQTWPAIEEDLTNRLYDLYMHVEANKFR